MKDIEKVVERCSGGGAETAADFSDGVILCHLQGFDDRWLGLASVPKGRAVGEDGMMMAWKTLRQLAKPKPRKTVLTLTTFENLRGNELKKSTITCASQCQPKNCPCGIRGVTGARLGIHPSRAS